MGVVRVVSVVCCLSAGFSNKTRVTGIVALVLYTAVRLAARQVACFALVFAARRSGARRQKYEILSRGQFRFRFGFRLRSFLGGKLCVQSQIVIRHRVVGPLVVELCVSVPAVESAVILHNCRQGNRLFGINRTEGVRAFSARDMAVVQNVGQRVRLNVVLRADVNLNGSVAVIGLGKVEAELILAVFVFGRFAESGRVEHYTVDGVMVGVSLANQNGRNGKGLVVPECPDSSEPIGTVFVTALDVNLIGYAAAVGHVGRLVVNRPVGNVDLNHLRIVGTNQIVEYQLVVVGERPPGAVCLITVL